MGRTLLASDEKNAYTLSDRGTFLTLSERKKISLKVLFEGDPLLYNPYSVIAVNPNKYSHVKYKLVLKYINFLTSELGQNLISKYQVNGKNLFYPFKK